MAELPIMPVKVAALLADTIHMTSEEFGAYCRILFALWEHGGMLRHDQKLLRRITGCTARRWGHIQGTVMAPLTICEGYVSQKRLSSTMLDVREYRAQLTAAGRIGANRRWLKTTQHEQIIPFRKPNNFKG
jgi:uncharacterized protein YdaU (DUF1376 family)